MTALATPSVAAMPTNATRTGVRPAVTDLVVFSVSLYITTLFAEATGGRGKLALTKAAVAVVVALIAVRPWRQLRAGVLALAAAIAVAALVVCLVTPPGWFGANRAASYGLAAATFVTVAAFARQSARARTLGLIIAFAGAVQFMWAFIPWWGGGDQRLPMIGTFYWHNQFAAFLLAPALIALALLIEGRSPWHFGGWIVALLAVAGVIFSSSRGALLALVVGWLAVGVLAWRARRSGRRVVARWCAATVLAAGVSFALTAPPFFATERLPWSASEARAATGETAVANGHWRVYMWREAVSVFESHPAVGVGYGALAPAAAKVTPAGWPRSPLAHDDYLQSLTDGGLLLGLPFLAACAALAVTLARRLRGYARTRRFDARTGIVVAATVLMAHSAIDFNWSYPALFALSAAVVALAVAPVLRRPAMSNGQLHQLHHPIRAMASGPAARVVLVGLLIGAVLFGAIAGRNGGVRLAYQVQLSTASTGTSS